MKRFISILLLICFSFGVSSFETNEFNYNNISEKVHSLQLYSNINESVDINGFTKITNNFEGHTVDIGFPELPTYTTFYQLDVEKEYEYDFIVNDSYIIEDINIYPHQGGDGENSSFIINNNFYLSENIYPENNFYSSERMHSRGFDLIAIEVIPYKYYPHTKILEVFTDIEIIVNEIGPRQGSTNQITQRSKVFDSLLENYVINFETTNRDADYQTPAILYICGGASCNYLDNLLEWRHEQGYIVYTATLGETGSSASSIKNYIQNAYYNWENPPEYVALVGDVGGSYSLPTFYDGFGHNSYGNDCEGDLPYSQLDGDDFIPEVIIGRISVRSQSEIGVVIAKILAYEKATYIDNISTSWYEGAALVGDPSSSGQSTIHVNQYIDNLLQNHGFNNVETSYSGNFDNWMEDQLEDGVLYINYRGYLGVSGFDGDDIIDAVNGYKTPFSTILTCGTGSFAEENTCLSEAMLRYGSVSSPRGAIAAVSTATWNTHTLFNNIVAMGMYDGIFSKNLSTTGLALSSGKLALLHTYPGNSASSWVGAFTQWNNLMGDPAVLLWTDTPSTLSVEHVNSLTIGSNIIDISVMDESGNPVTDAWVTILKGDDEIFQSKLSDNNGMVSFNWDGNVSSGEIKLTITKRNYIPYQNDIIIADSGDHVSLSEVVINDEFGGNNDGLLNPGEYIGLSLSLNNLSNNFLTNISGYIESDNVNAYIENDNVTFNNVASNGNTSNTDLIYLTLDYSAIDEEDLDLRLYLNINGTDHIISIPIEVVGGNINILNYDSNDHNVTIGELNDINITVRNEGSISMQSLTIELLPYENLVTVPSSIQYIFQISPGNQQNIGPFQINVSNQAIAGTIIPMEFNISDSNGFNQSILVNIQLGLINQHDPLGPDAYGYYIYDSSDTFYDSVPIYDWIELDDGMGTQINLDDDGNANGSNLTEVIQLPFTFKFYGVDYNEITVAVDGYMSFGNHEVACHRNYPIPGPGGPSPMIAPFWDDMKTGSNGYVYKYLSDEYVIIQWDYLRTYENNSRETFQVILYNSEFSNYETITGDGEIKIQYEDFNNTSSGDWGSYPPLHAAYSTIGIKNHLGDIGLEYSYNNQYPTAAMPLSDGTALFITTGQMNNYLIGDISGDDEINVLDVVQLVNIILNIIDPSGYQMIVSDINSDGDINVLDVVQLVNIILN